MSTTIRIRRVLNMNAPDLQGLVQVLCDCVEGGASVSFMLPFSADDARSFWLQVGEGLPSGARALLVADDEQGVCGTVQLVLAQPDNQPHRADLAKMLVHRRARERGVGAALLAAAETLAGQLGKSLLVLDTASAAAERLYQRGGWVRVGCIPDYALLPAGGFCDTVVYYRQLPAARQPELAAAPASR